ncbi:MAG: CRTAC1 family protein [Pseudomonadota bacterium]
MMPRLPRFTCRLALAAVAGLAHAPTAAAAGSVAKPSPFPHDIPKMALVTDTSGIDHRYTGPWEYFVGGGVATFDCNGDRRPDLVIAGGASDAQLYVNRSQAGGAIRFDVAPTALPAAVRKRVLGAYPIDIDNDGRKDLVLLRVGGNAILKGGPDCSFTRAARRFAIAPGRAWTTSFAATFEAGASTPTLAFGNYVDRAAPGSPWGTCHDNVVFRGSADRTPPNYAEAAQAITGHCTLSLLFTDWDRSGTPALRVTNDRQYYRGGEEQLWRLAPGRPARPFRRADGWRSLKIWGMGIAEADLDADGFPEYALTSMGDTKLQVLDREADDLRPVYRDAAFAKGATAHRPYTGGDLKPSTGWHAAFADFNNDARTDLLITKGNVEQMPEFAATDPDNLLLGTHDGRFHEAGADAGIALPTRGRGAAVADLNMDGRLDLVIVNRDAQVAVFQNRGARTQDTARQREMGNWLQLELSQADINRDAVGATILIKTGNLTQSRRVFVGGGHASGALGFVHVGLGVAERAVVRVRWPDGDWSPDYRVFANNFVILPRGAAKARYWFPPAASQSE